MGFLWQEISGSLGVCSSIDLIEFSLLKLPDALKERKKNTEGGTRGFFLMNSPHPPCANLNLKIYKIKRGKISSKISFETSKARAGITKIPGKPLLEWPSRSQKNNNGFIHIKLG